MDPDQAVFAPKTIDEAMTHAARSADGPPSRVAKTFRRFDYFDYDCLDAVYCERRNVVAVNTLAMKTPIVAADGEHKALGAVVDALKQSKQGRARLVGPDGRHVVLPQSICAVLREAVRQLSSGNGVAILPVTTTLTTQQVAEVLSVSRPFVVQLLERGEMPFHLAGTHRRVYLRDLMQFKAKRDTVAREALRRRK